MLRAIEDVYYNTNVQVQEQTKWKIVRNVLDGTYFSNKIRDYLLAPDSVTGSFLHKVTDKTAETIGRFYLSHILIRKIKKVLIQNVDSFIKEPLSAKLKELSKKNFSYTDDDSILKKVSCIAGEQLAQSSFELAYDGLKLKLIEQIEVLFSEPILHLSAEASRQVGGVVLRQITKISVGMLFGSSLASFLALDQFTKDTSFESLGDLSQKGIHAMTSISGQLALWSLLNSWHLSKSVYHLSFSTNQQLKKDFSDFVADKMAHAINNVASKYISNDLCKTSLQTILKDNEIMRTLNERVLDLALDQLGKIKNS